MISKFLISLMENCSVFDSKKYLISILHPCNKLFDFIYNDDNQMEQVEESKEVTLRSPYLVP